MSVTQMETAIILDFEGVQRPCSFSPFIKLRQLFLLRIIIHFSQSDFCHSPFYGLLLCSLFKVLIHTKFPKMTGKHWPRFFTFVTTKGAFIEINFLRPALSKAAQKRPPKQEVTMRLITKFELAARNKDELYALYRKVFNELANTTQNSIEYANALASLENIQYEIGARESGP